MAMVKGSSIYKKYSSMAAAYDIIAGYIANDRMFVVLDRFFSGDITDTALINSLAAIKLGKQFVAITERACKQIEITATRPLGIAERASLRSTAAANRQEGIRKAEEICKNHRRDGRFFDEILEEGS
jgi:hypothetical protein